MRFNRASTPEDFQRAFGNSNDPSQQWRKIGGGNKMGSAGAAVNAARRAQEANRDARKAARDNPFSINALNNEIGQIAGVYGDMGMHDIDGRGHFVTTGQLQKMKADPARFGLSPSQIRMINKIKI